MIKRPAFLLFILLLGVSFISSSCSAPFKKPKIINNPKYILCVPEGIDTSKKYPLVVALAPGANAQSAQLMIDTWQDVSNKYKWVIFASKEFPNGTDMNAMMPSLASIVVEVSSKFPIDKTKIIAAGHSAGGMTSHAFSFLYPRLISAVVINTGMMHEYYIDNKHKYPRGKLAVFLASPTDFRYAEMKRDRKFVEGLGWKTKWIEFKGGHTIAPNSAYEKAAEWLNVQFNNKGGSALSTKIDGIMYSEEDPLVIIGGEVYSINDPICGGRIVDISPKIITIEFKDKVGSYKVGDVVKD